jgi:hypothetical protein
MLDTVRHRGDDEIGTAFAALTGEGALSVVSVSFCVLVIQ